MMKPEKNVRNLDRPWFFPGLFGDFRSGIVISAFLLACLCPQWAKAADTDGDGLVDLLETLYGADPNLGDTDGDGLSDAFELGITVGAGPNRAMNTTPGADDLLHDHAIWLGPDLMPGTTAAGDDLQVIPRGLGYPRFFVTDPGDQDSDNDGVSDFLELATGANPLNMSITPRFNLLALDFASITEGIPDIAWTGSDHPALHPVPVNLGRGLLRGSKF